MRTRLCLNWTGTTSDVNWDLTMVLKSGADPTKLASYSGTLTISGIGEMADYDFLNDTKTEYQVYSDNGCVNRIEISSGVTKIGSDAFRSIETVNTFIIPATISYIGGDAFFGCNNPQAEVYISANPASLTWYDNKPAYIAESYPDDFLTHVRGPWGISTWYVQGTKCYVPSEYLATYKAKGNTGNAYVEGSTDVNVFFASKLSDQETESGMNTMINNLDGQEVPVVTITRPLNRDGYFATICLPFDMSAEQIAESSLHGAEIREFTNATVDGGTLIIEFQPVIAIEAGKPYFIKYTDPDALGDALDRIDFIDVVIDNSTPAPVTHGGLTMTGTFVPKSVQARQTLPMVTVCSSLVQATLSIDQA